MKANEECCLCYSGDIEICNTEYTGEFILTPLTRICSDVGLMFSHDGRTERWDTDGSNCLINLELLNISAYKEKSVLSALVRGRQLCVCGEPCNTEYTVGGDALQNSLCFIQKDYQS